MKFEDVLRRLIILCMCLTGDRSITPSNRGLHAPEMKGSLSFPGGLMRARIAGLMTTRNMLFLVFSIGIVAIFYGSFRELMKLSFKSELYSHIILIPVISGYFFYEKRKSLSLEGGSSGFLGAAITVPGAILYFIGIGAGGKLNANDYLSVMMFSAVTMWIGGFILFYGTEAFKVARFPLLFLFFLTPIPSALIERFILVLQLGSTEVTDLLFRVTGVPVLRDGFVFNLPGVSIRVAKQCSGIRSSIALVITSLIAGKLFLNTNWRRVVLILCAFPITIFKNGLRIAGLSILGAYVDPRILGSELHTNGGIPFFGVGLLLLAPVLWHLVKSEKKVSGKSQGVRC